MPDSHIPSLRSTESTGRHKFAVVTDDQRAMGISPWLGSPCGGCQKLTAEGEQITSYRRSWWHLDCAHRDLAVGSVEDAWLTLGHQLARSPGDFRVGETRAIVGALLGLAEDAVHKHQVIDMAGPSEKALATAAREMIRQVADDVRSQFAEVQRLASLGFTLPVDRIAQAAARGVPEAMA